MNIYHDSAFHDKFRKKLGKKAEKAALKYLKKNGYKLIRRNYETAAGEIDIIVRKQDLIAFVEVRSKTTPFLVSPEQSINMKKQQKIINTAVNFIQKYQIKDKNFSFDIVSVIFDEKSVIQTLNHIPNAFTPKTRIGFL